MHELSMAMSIAEIALEEAQWQGAVRVLRVRLRLGEFAGVVEAALRSSIQMAREGSLLEGVELVIEMVPVRVRCPNCQEVRPVDSVQMLCCAACGTFTAEIVSGRELEVVALEIQ